MSDNISFCNARQNTEYEILSCVCEERLAIFGFRVGEKILIKGECPFGGTVIIRCCNEEFCVRRNEIDAIIKEVY